MPFYDVSRTTKGGFPGYGLQSLVQRKVVSASVAPAGGTLSVETAQSDWKLDTAQTTLPVTVTDHYGGFPV